MIIKENNEMVSVHFESMIELMEFEPSKEINKRKFNYYIKPNRSKGENANWLGGNTYTEIVNMALLGDNKTYKIAKSRMQNLTKGEISSTVQKINKVKRKKFRCDNGDELDIHKVYQGALGTAWSKTKRIEVDEKHHLVTLFMNINGSCNVKFNDTIWRCSLLLKLVEEIQLSGKSVKVIVGGLVNNAMKNDNRKLTVSITIKKYNETLSPERLAAMTNIGFYRTFGFAAKECQGKVVRNGGGKSCNIDKNYMPIHLKEEVERGHTKPVFLKGVQSMESAIYENKNAYMQMKSFINK